MGEANLNRLLVSPSMQEVVPVFCHDVIHRPRCILIAPYFPLRRKGERRALFKRLKEHNPSGGDHKTRGIQENEKVAAGDNTEAFHPRPFRFRP
jgi:hypothetical protein